MIKLFEDFINVNIGDFVYCKNPELSSYQLETDKKYQILDIIREPEDDISDSCIKVDNGTNNQYWLGRFISELDYNMKNYNL